MNFELSEEQQLLSDSLRKYLANDYSFDARTRVVASTIGYNEKTWAAFAAMRPACARSRGAAAARWT